MNGANGVMLQGFHWYLPADGSLWSELAAQASALAQAGFTALWLPPAYKDNDGPRGVGYAVYDMYDLGEFDQKGSLRTKYGTKDAYLAAVRAAQLAGMQVYVDTVFNHRIGCDGFETVRAIPYARTDRTRAVGPAREIEAPTLFTFPGRQGRHSTFKWNAAHFDAVDYDRRRPDDRDVVYLFEGKRFDSDVALEGGNFDFLMGADLDIEHPEVRQELVRWGQWCLDVVGCDGFRLDAVKHISAPGWPRWLDALQQHAGRELFCVAEYWSTDLAALHWFLNTVGAPFHLFDVPLHYRFHEASRNGSGYDLRKLLDDTLMQQRPTQAVTFVDNHDSQPLQALESVVEPWFKPLAYATILLRQGGYPCVFYADYYGAAYEDRGRDGNPYQISLPSHRPLIDALLDARRNDAFGPELDYFDHPNCIGWVRRGDQQHPRSLAVLMSNGDAGHKRMDVGRPHRTYVDLLGGVPEPIVSGPDGWAEFHCPGGGVAVWVER